MPMKDVVCIGQPKARQQGAWAGLAGWLAGATRRGEHDVTCFADVIAAVRSLPADTIVDGLFLLDHGNESHVLVGDEDIGGTILTGPGYAAQIRQLRPYMSGEGFIYVMNCHAGKHETMLLTLAAEAGVRAYAGTGFYNDIYGVNTGEYRMAYPSGTIITTSRPRHWGLGG